MSQNICNCFFNFRVQWYLDWEVSEWELDSLQEHLVTFDLPKGFRRKQNGTGNSLCVFRGIKAKNMDSYWCLPPTCLPASINVQ